MKNSHPANSPRAGQQAHNEKGNSGGVDNHKCLGGGVVSENADAASFPRVVS